jgi:putative drug exporter of the RND superfamily
MSRLLAWLGAWVGCHPAAVIGIWLPVVLAASFGARELAVVARGGSGVLDDSAAQRAAAELNREFDEPWVDPLTLAIASDPYTRDDAIVSAALACSRSALEARAEVRAVIDLEEDRPSSGGVGALVIALHDPELDAEEREVPLLRASLEPCRRDFLRADPDGRYALTGRAAYTVDLNAWNKRSSEHAERCALPVTLAILVLVFGSLLAAALPLLMGVATTTVALALAWAVAQLMPVSNLTATVITMLGLALGIDYSLLLVSRFRELPPGLTRPEAMGRLLASAGPTITWSGLIVSIALLGLLCSPLLETRGIGIGGALVAAVSVLAATTLLPAVLALSAERIHRRGARSREGPPGFYARLVARIVRRPLATVMLTVALLSVMALPGLTARSGYSNDPRFFPAGMEARVGGEILSARGHGNDALALELLVHAAGGRSVLDAAILPALFEYGRQLTADRRVASVASVVNLAPNAALGDYLALYHDPDAALSRYPEIAHRWLSRRRDVALFHVTPAHELSLADIQQLAAELARRARPGPLSIEVGGAPSYFNDFDRSLARSLPRVVGVIILATIALLLAAFRSWLIPLKAVLLNLLAVAAGFGVVVAVCQWGWGARLVGLDAPLTAIPATVPLMIFCLSFGVSMDYELFLLFRIVAEFRRDGDTTRATVAGVGSAAPVVTGAAFIMAVVFASFVASDVPLVKMLGLGLAAAVAVDAMLIRTLLLPAAMTLAGRWNWYPGLRAVRAP